jgi:two-component system, OmpR family, response regulator
MMNTKKRILLAEDDDNLGTLLATFLKAKNYEVELCSNGKIAVEKFNQQTFDFVVLDVMMPEMDGFAVAKEIRELDKRIPLLFLTAKSMKEDKLKGFDLGADDYLTKPFSMEELLARLQAIGKRVFSNDDQSSRSYQLASVEFDPIRRVLKIAGEERKLTTKESQLLNLLCKNQNEILDRQAALRAIWGDDNYFNGRSMDVYIAKIRKLLKEEERIEIINVHGKGFRLTVNQ